MNVEAFVRDALERADLAELVLVHLGEVGQHGEDARELASEKLPRKKRPAAGELARRFERAARADAESLGGRRRYRLTGFSIRGRTLDSIAWMIDGGELDDLGVPKSREKALAKQNLRMHEYMLKCSEGTAAALMVQNAQLLEEVKNLRGQIGTQFVDMAAKVAELSDRKHERELETKQLEASEGRKERLWAHLERAIPMALASMSGSTVTAKIVKSLRDDQRAKLFEILDEEQLQDLWTALAQDKAAKDAVGEIFDVTAVSRITGAAASSPAAPPPNGSPT